MKTLKGRPIGLNASMSLDQMLSQLRRNFETWRKEGFKNEEIIAALIAKARPLINGYYWKRYPEARERCKKALELFLNEHGKNVKFEKAKGIKPIRTKRSSNLLNQFNL